MRTSSLAAFVIFVASFFSAAASRARCLKKSASNSLARWVRYAAIAAEIASSPADASAASTAFGILTSLATTRAKYRSLNVSMSMSAT
ncbi:hypothetical protein X942_6491 [Burkholderia pseudomallei MSHR5596]|nr:hypothetical protein X942_6491 [Burkholderia pseudomallei MSHR5596]